MSYNTREKPIWNCTNEYLSKKERISSELSVSSNSLRVVTEKYFCLTLLYCWHSRIIWTTVNQCKHHNTPGLYSVYCVCKQCHQVG